MHECYLLEGILEKGPTDVSLKHVRRGQTEEPINLTLLRGRLYCVQIRKPGMDTWWELLAHETSVPRIPDPSNLQLHLQSLSPPAFIWCSLCGAHSSSHLWLSLWLF